VPQDEPEKTEHHTLEVKHFISRRLDHYVASRFPDYSRSYIQKLIRREMVLVNGKPGKASHEIRQGDVIEVELPVIVRPGQLAQDIPLDIIYEDDDFVAINKPADMVTHPAKGHSSGTLVNALLHHCGWQRDDPDDLRPGVVHRLDKNTTGIMLFGKHELAQSRIQQQFENREVSKTYLAIVQGDPQFDEDIVKLPVGRHRQAREKMAVDRIDGKEAVTIYRVKERFGDFTLVQAEPKTGRTHQIRVHLSAIRHPVACDATYGARPTVYRSELYDEPPREDEKPLIARTALHATRIEFSHPTTRQRVSFEAPLAPDMAALLEELRRRGAT
jgi:23S rRNA pseudouridine1911/1915/1917 synthase